jgi:hypothetical protein
MVTAWKATGPVFKPLHSTPPTMKLISLDQDAKTALIEFHGKQRTVEFEFGHDPNQISFPIAGRVGATGTKLWIGYQAFFLTNGRWSRGSAIGGLNGKAFTPVCFVEDMPEKLKSLR